MFVWQILGPPVVLVHADYQFSSPGSACQKSFSSIHRLRLPLHHITQIQREREERREDSGSSGAAPKHLGIVGNDLIPAILHVLLYAVLLLATGLT